METSSRISPTVDVTLVLPSQNGELELGLSILVSVRRHLAAQLKNALKCAVKHLNKVITKVQAEIEILSDVISDANNEAYLAFEGSFLAFF